MALDQLKNFLGKVEKDDSLKIIYNACKKKDEVVNLGQKSGFVFTKEELNEYFKVDDLNLDNISGGVGRTGCETPSAACWFSLSTD